MKRQQGFTIWGWDGIFILLLPFAVWGYIWNIVKIIGALQLHDPVTGMFMLRCIGVLVLPLGVIMGFQ